MSAPLRPAFHEGQVLSAADLSATVAYARDSAARHARLLHAWGIVEGLALTTESRTDPTTNDRYAEVSVAPGCAVDGNGREVLVDTPAILRESDFEEVNGADQATDEPYPVFLTAADRRPDPRTATDSCGTSGTPGTRVEESYQILFGRLGDERLVADQRPPDVGAPLTEPPARWLILLGYVRWSEGRFTGVETQARQVGPRYAGVRADTVAARSGTLTLRTGPLPEEGAPALVLTGGDPPGLVFGLYQGGGTVAPLMTVAANGNLSIAGSFSGRMSVGSTLVVSGSATDGMLLPLPSGVTREQIADGRVVLHTHLTPRVPPLPNRTTLASPVEATVDADRRVRCRIRLHDTKANTVVERTGAVDFLVLATVAAPKGGA
ncbi:hypothetical protein ACFVIM_14440 [Streptomyces sp. NPDC057638]|uniref:hypothetical protein n=1 Tax=Streptomyces sp. NPDC057638 TaxID=3346190 RepID=UPI0036BBAA3F